MSKIWLLILFVAISCTIVTYYIYGLCVFIYPPVFLLVFFAFFGLRTLGDSIRAGAIPGIEELDEPNFVFSGIYMAWLYANDREGWAKYAALFSYLVGAFFSSIIGLIISFSLEMGFNASLAGWLLGMFVTLLIAIKVAVSKRWTESKKYQTINYN
jgi:hypothetical protein